MDGLTSRILVGLLGSVLALGGAAPSSARGSCTPSWTVVPAALALIPSQAAQLFAGDAALTAADAFALATATVAAAFTLAVPAERPPR